MAIQMIRKKIEELSEELTKYENEMNIAEEKKLESEIKKIDKLSFLFDDHCKIKLVRMLENMNSHPILNDYLDFYLKNHPEEVNKIYASYNKFNLLILCSKYYNSGYTNVETFKVLLNNGFNPNWCDDVNFDCVTYLFANVNHKRPHEEKYQILDLLIEHGYKIRYNTFYALYEIIKEMDAIQLEDLTNFTKRFDTKDFKNIEGIFRTITNGKFSEQFLKEFKLVFDLYHPNFLFEHFGKN